MQQTGKAPIGEGEVQSTKLAPAERSYITDEVKAQELNLTKEEMTKLFKDVETKMHDIIDLYFGQEMNKMSGQAAFDGLESVLLGLIPGFGVFGIINASVSGISDIVKDFNESDQWDGYNNKITEVFDKVYKGILNNKYLL